MTMVTCDKEGCDVEFDTDETGVVKSKLNGDVMSKNYYCCIQHSL